MGMGVCGYMDMGVCGHGCMWVWVYVGTGVGMMTAPRGRPWLI